MGERGGQREEQVPALMTSLPVPLLSLLLLDLWHNNQAFCDSVSLSVIRAVYVTEAEDVIQELRCSEEEPAPQLGNEGLGEKRCLHTYLSACHVAKDEQKLLPFRPGSQKEGETGSAEKGKRVSGFL